MSSKKSIKISLFVTIYMIIPMYLNFSLNLFYLCLLFFHTLNLLKYVSKRAMRKEEKERKQRRRIRK